jgi:nitrate reductase assembly molybdenum cofactor insertion protein NarJ
MMSTGLELDSVTVRLLAEAQEWHLLGRLFERPRPEWRAELVRLAESVGDAELSDAARLSQGASEGTYLATFGPSGIVSPRGVAHGGMRDPGQLLADLQARYDAFGFRPAVEDTIDHLSVEVGFVAYLKLKEAFARAEGDPERAAIAAEAADGFVADHLSDMGEPIANRLEAVGEPYLTRAARILARRVGSPKGAAPARVVWLEDEDELSCGEAQP